MRDRGAPTASNQFQGAEQYQYDQRELSVDVTTGNYESHRLVGYDPNIELQADWPGAEVDPNRLRLNPQGLRDVATKLRAKAMDLASVPSEVSAGTQARFGPDSWPQAVALRNSSSAVSTKVAEYLQIVVDNLNQAASTIEAALAQYEAGERANDASVRNVHSDLGGGEVQAWEL